MKQLILMFHLAIVVSGYAQTKEDIQKTIEANLGFVEKYLSLKAGETIGDEIYYACQYLEKVTGIESPIAGGLEPTYDPTRKTYCDWKTWYAKNKDKVYWDENSSTVKIAE